MRKKESVSGPCGISSVRVRQVMLGGTVGQGTNGVRWQCCDAFFLSLNRDYSFELHMVRTTTCDTCQPWKLSICRKSDNSSSAMNSPQPGRADRTELPESEMGNRFFTAAPDPTNSSKNCGPQSVTPLCPAMCRTPRSLSHILPKSMPAGCGRPNRMQMWWRSKTRRTTGFSLSISLTRCVIMCLYNTTTVSKMGPGSVLWLLPSPTY